MSHSLRDCNHQLNDQWPRSKKNEEEKGRNDSQVKKGESRD